MVAEGVEAVSRFDTLTDDERELLAEAVGGWLDGALGIEPARFVEQHDTAERLLRELDSA